MLCRAFESVECNFVLLISVSVVARSNIRCTIALDNVSLGTLHLRSDGRSTFFGSDVANEGNDIGINGTDG